MYTEYANMIDDYITREPQFEVVGHCNNCGEILESGMDYTELDGKVYCDDYCISQYYEIEEFVSTEYCEQCDEPLVDIYIVDVFGNKFCDLECLKKYYK